MIKEDELKEIEQRCLSAQDGPWKAYVEGQDHLSGSNFIMIGEGPSRKDYVEFLGATSFDLYFIAISRY